MRQNLSQDLNEMREQIRYLKERCLGRGNNKHKALSIES